MEYIEKQKNLEINNSIEISKEKEIELELESNLVNEEEYMELLLMPETFLLFRFFFEDLGYTQEWREEMAALTDEEREELLPIIYKNEFNHIEELTDNKKFRKILTYYKDYRKEIADHSSELYRLKQEFEKRQKEKQEKI